MALHGAALAVPALRRPQTEHPPPTVRVTTCWPSSLALNQNRPVLVVHSSAGEEQPVPESRGLAYLSSRSCRHTFSIASSETFPGGTGHVETPETARLLRGATRTPRATNCRCRSEISSEVQGMIRATGVLRSQIKTSSPSGPVGGARSGALSGY